MNTPIEPHEIAKASRSILRAKQCVHKTLRLHAESGETLLTDERRAELEAVCVILGRACGDIARKYPVKRGG